MIKSKRKYLFFIGYTIILLWSIFYYAPGITFYFDQEDGQGEITKVVEKRVYLKYFHKESNKEISISFSEGNKSKIDNLRMNEMMNIIYSKNFPSEIVIVDYHSSPGPGGIAIIGIFLIPLLSFKWIKFDS